MISYPILLSYSFFGGINPSQGRIHDQEGRLKFFKLMLDKQNYISYFLNKEQQYIVVRGDY
jgi:hypothetical protein